VSATLGSEALVHGSPVPLYLQLSDLLREQIKRGVYGPLDRLPSEHELVRAHGVSRITARQALSELERAGLVFRLQGRGSFVARPPVVQRLTGLHGFAEAMAAQGVTSVSRVLKTTTVRATPSVAAALAVEAGEPVTELRRLRLADGAPVSLDVSYFRLEIGQRLLRQDLTRHDVFWLLENACGVTLGSADYQIAAIDAEEDIALHLGVPSGTAVLFIERLTRDAQGTPVDHEHLYVRTDRIRYGLTLNRSPKEPA
jgi:GntR family transcriptional regulator